MDKPPYPTIMREQHFYPDPAVRYPSSGPFTALAPRAVPGFTSSSLSAFT